MSKETIIADADWRDFLLGLQEKLNLEQAELMKSSGLKNDFHVSEWISGKRIPVIDKKSKFVELCKKSGFKPVEIINFGKFVREGIKLNNKWVSVRGASTLENIDDSILMDKSGKVCLNVLRFFPLQKGNNLIKFLENGDDVIIFYDEKRSTRPIPLVLPKFLEIDKTFLTGLGIYIGEGSRNRHPKVTNSEPAIINQAIKFFDLFGIDRLNMKAWIQLHERSPFSFEDAKLYWINNTYLKFENITSIRIKDSIGFAPVSPFGVIHLEVHSILLQLFINNLVNLTPQLIGKLSKENIAYFLKGLFAAEGSVGLSKSGSVNEISYTSTRKDERMLVKSLLEEQGIEVHNNDKRFALRIHGFRNLKRLTEMDIFEYHPERSLKLKQGFSQLNSFFKSS